MSGQERQIPGLLDGFGAIIRRDLLLAWKRPGDVLNPLFFFAMVASLFPLAVGPSPEQLMLNGPGVVWVAALLATLLSLNSLFLSDLEDGSLDQIILSPATPAVARARQGGGPLAANGPAAGAGVAIDRNDLPDARRHYRRHDADTGPWNGQFEPAGRDWSGAHSGTQSR